MRTSGSRGATVSYLDHERIARAKRGFTTRRVQLAETVNLIHPERPPRAGDLVLAKVDQVGQHNWLEGPNGRHQTLFVGDELLVAYGNRYAPDYFEAVVPDHAGPCHLVAAGGLAGTVLNGLSGLKTPTMLTPIGLLADDEGRVLNLARWTMPLGEDRRRVPTIAVLGTAMNAGKTTAAAWLVRGLARLGRRPGAAKVTGTGAGKDLWLMADAGAALVLDFTDAGHASTYLLSPEAVDRVIVTLTRALGSAGCDSIVLEIADGIYQPETAAILTSKVFRDHVDGVVFAASDAAGAAAGVAALERAEIAVVGASGRLTMAPLAIRETEMATGVPVFDLEALADPATFDRLTMVHERAG